MPDDMWFAHADLPEWPKGRRILDLYSSHWPPVRWRLFEVPDGHIKVCWMQAPSDKNSWRTIWALCSLGQGQSWDEFVERLRGEEARKWILSQCETHIVRASERVEALARELYECGLPNPLGEHIGLDGWHYNLRLFDPVRDYSSWCALPQNWETLDELVGELVGLVE